MKQTLCCLLVTVVAAACGDQSTPMVPTAAQSPPPPKAAVQSGPADDLVATPNGWYHRGCVHEVPNGAHLDIHGLVKRLDGTTYQIALCSQPGRVANGGNAASGPTLSGWIERADYVPGTYWGTITASWHVPAAPTSAYASNQVYYTFPGIQSSAYIVQPVLTYGYAPDYGGNYWSAASWRCNTGSNCHHGPAISAAVGDSVLGSASATGCANGICTWTITIADVTSGARGSYSADDTSAYTDAVGGAVEVYNLTSCGQFPANGILYTGITLYDQSQNQATPSWSTSVASGGSPSCGLHITSSSTAVSLYDDVGPAVIVTGPTKATEYSYVTATAQASGGFTPYGYSWTVDGTAACGNQATCSAYIGAAGTFTLFAVTVTDAYQLTASGALNVNACPPAGTAARVGYPTGLYLASLRTYCAAGAARATPPAVRGE